jgi:hypothetical protein
MVHSDSGSCCAVIVRDSQTHGFGTCVIAGLRYKLRMFGVPIDGPAIVLSDNQTVVLNSTIPSSTLRHKHNAICYQRVCEAVTAGMIRIAKVDTKQNQADMFIKPLPAYLLHDLIIRILY